MAQSNREDVSLSFHCIRRTKKKVGDEEKRVPNPFKQEDFEELFKGLELQKKRKLNDGDFQSQLRLGNQCVINSVEHKGRFISGIYGKSYSGHEYKNSDHGVISAQSLNIRPFFFQLYLSDDGAIYMATQYLGNWGGYAVLRNMLHYLLGNTADLRTTSFNTNRAFAVNAIPTEVEITYTKKGESITKGKSYGRAGIIGFKRSEGDESFSLDVKKDFLSLLKTKDEKLRRKAIAEVISTELYEFDDEEIQDCKIIAKVNKRTRTIRILDKLNIASRFPVDVQVGKSGHPPYTEMKDKSTDILKDEILAVVEDG